MKTQPIVLSQHLRLGRVRSGAMLYNVNDAYVGRSLDTYGEFSGLECDLLDALLQPGDVAVDAGANIGVMTLSMARRVGAQGFVYSFEPQRVVHQMLCANVALNDLRNVDCRRLALSDAPGTISIGAPDYSRPGNFGGVEAGHGEKVAAVTLDNELGPQPKLRLIKIDVEGMEAAVVRGAAALIGRSRPVLYVENDREDKSPELIRTIRDLGYALFWHGAWLYRPENFFGEAQNVFPRVLSKNMLCLPQEAATGANIGLPSVAG